MLNMQPIHPAPTEFSDDQLTVDPILRHFHYAHLPVFLQGISSPFCSLASFIVTDLPRNAERTVALRKLLEAKDAAVRANVGNIPLENFKTRLDTEYRQLSDRFDKLHQFIEHAAAFRDLPDVDQRLLMSQRATMGMYLETLAQRIDRAEGKETEFPVIGEAQITGGDRSEEPIPFS